jgi:HTH-type transcriptional regulator / antitoxin HigA
MSEFTGYSPDWASPPGDTIADILRSQQIDINGFASAINMDVDIARELIAGNQRISLDIAKALAKALGSTSEFWLKREKQYREKIDESVSVDETSSEELSAWLATLPIADMQKFGWIPKSNDPADQIDDALEFFDVRSISEWRARNEPRMEVAAFRTTDRFEANPHAVAAWMRQGEILADKIQCKDWNRAKFEQSLNVVRRLTWFKEPVLFLSKLQSICADCGVAVVIVRAPKGCRASGATWFPSPNKAIIIMSFRYLSDDHFWFTFFHEAGHVILHQPNALFLEDGSDVTREEEREANEFASSTLIPPEFGSELLSNSWSAARVLAFARKLGIAPGIVVGQLQHRGLVPINKMNRLKRRFKWD